MMGLTHRQPAISDSTLRQVRSLGFDFTPTSPITQDLKIPARTASQYNQGILFVGDYNKKIDVFETFLSMIGKRPKKVVFIDDKRTNVEELEYLSKHGIEYIGIHYRAIEYAEQIYSREMVKIQYQPSTN